MQISDRKLASALCGIASLGGLLGVPLAFAAAPVESGVANSTVELEVVREIEAGDALADYWVAEPVEYRATAEAVLTSVGGNSFNRDSIGASALTDFLFWFGGGAGAPRDLVKLRPLESATVQQETVVK